MFSFQFFNQNKFSLFNIVMKTYIKHKNLFNWVTNFSFLFRIIFVIMIPNLSIPANRKYNDNIFIRNITFEMWLSNSSDDCSCKFPTLWCEPKLQGIISSLKISCIVSHSYNLLSICIFDFNFFVSLYNNRQFGCQFVCYNWNKRLFVLDTYFQLNVYMCIFSLVLHS